MTIINSMITSGIQPSGTKTITSNGVVDVTNYANADVQVPTTAPALYRSFELNNGHLVANTTDSFLMSFAGITNIDDVVLYCAYKNNTAISGPVVFPDLKSISAYTGLIEAFYGCTGITSAEFPVLESITSGNTACGRMFQNSGISTLDMSSLTTVSNNAAMSLMFAGTNLVNVTFDSLKIIQLGVGLLQQCFYNCSSLRIISFPALTSTSFGSRTDQFGSMLSGCTDIVMHFPNNIQATVETLTGYSTTTPFGAINGSILFDLPSTDLLTGVNTTIYERNPKYDTATSLSWRINNSQVGTATPYYTNGIIDPQVGDTIYSDAACTIAVTTIDSIA